MKRYIKIYALLILVLTISYGCLEETEVTPVSFEVSNSSKLLSYLESHGDLINSGRVPLLVDAEEVFDNTLEYLIIDVRSVELYNLGHIENSVNVKNDELLKYIDSSNASQYSKIVLVSQTGQAASYYASLLTLLGYNNIYSMNFGMSAWNFVFAESWIKNREPVIPRNIFTVREFPKEQFHTPPDLVTAMRYNDNYEKLRGLVNNLLNEGFQDYFPAEVENRTASISATEMFEDYDFTEQNFSNYYVICYGNMNLYRPDPRFGAHPYSVPLYEMNIDLRSTTYLQTLPNNRPVVIYSYNGQISAFVTAYLRVLGYDAKSLIYGANTLIYNLMSAYNKLRPYAFTADKIMNYSFIMDDKN